MSRKNGVIYCNRCGKAICLGKEQEKVSFLAIRKEWGYFSENKDGKIYSVDLCEPCCDAVTREFLIAPQIDENTELV